MVCAQEVSDVHVSCGSVFLEGCRQLCNRWLIREAGGETSDYSLMLGDSVKGCHPGRCPGARLGAETAQDTHVPKPVLYI